MVVPVHITAHNYVRLRTPRRCYLWGAVLSAAGAATFALTVQETLPRDKRKPFELRKLADPLSFIRFFSRTPELRAVALLHVLQAVPTYNEVLPMYRKQVFGWGVRESATMAQLLNLTELVKPVVAARVLQSPGTRGTAAWGSRLDALAALNVALTGMPSTTYLNPVITSVCDQEASLSQAHRTVLTLFCSHAFTLSFLSRTRISPPGTRTRG